MTAVPNHALARLRAGELAIGLGVSQSRTIAIAQVAQTSGFDWIFIDCEHSSIDLDTAAQISDSREEAQKAANNCRYPPVGKRSVGGGLAQIGYKSMPVTLVVVMIESPASVRNCDEIIEPDRAATRLCGARPA